MEFASTYLREAHPLVELEGAAVGLVRPQPDRVVTMRSGMSNTRVHDQVRDTLTMVVLQDIDPLEFHGTATRNVDGWGLIAPQHSITDCIGTVEGHVDGDSRSNQVAFEIGHAQLLSDMTLDICL